MTSLQCLKQLSSAIRFWSRAGILCVACIALMGCGGASAPKAARDVSLQVGEAKLGAPAPGGKPGEPINDDAIVRRIIYTASIEVVVKELEKVQTELNRIIEASKGYVAKSDISGYVGSRRTATWTIKVPVEQFPRVMQQLAELGKVTKNSSDSQDVTEEFVDLQARIKNLKAEEEILNKFLKESVASVENYLKTRDQIKNVRGEIERAEGRLKYLTTMSAMSSITLTAREEDPYDPTPPPAAATFNDEIDSTFTSSWKALKRFGQTIFLVLVALAPWLPLILVGFLICRWILRALFFSTKTSKHAKESKATGGHIPVAQRVPDPDPKD